LGTENDKLERARMPGKLAKELHGFYQRKIEASLKTPVRSFSDFAIWYTPGQIDVSPISHVGIVDIFRKWMFVMFPIHPSPPVS
jgi:hypothetical protein